VVSFAFTMIPFMMMALALSFSILHLWIRGPNQLAPIRWFQRFKTKDLLDLLHYSYLRRKSWTSPVHLSGYCASNNTIEVHIQTSECQTHLVLCCSCHLAILSIFNPLFLRDSEQCHIKKHFGVSWLCFRVRLINHCWHLHQIKGQMPQTHPSLLTLLHCLWILFCCFPTGTMCCPTLVAYCSTIGNHSDSWQQLLQHLNHKLVGVPWTIPESYPPYKLDDFISSFDPLAIRVVDQLFNPSQPGPSLIIFLRHKS